MDQCLPETAWAPSLQIRTSFLSSLCKDLGVSLPFSPRLFLTLQEGCRRWGIWPSYGLVLPGDLWLLPHCQTPSVPCTTAGGGWVGGGGHSLQPFLALLLHIYPSPRSIHPSLCSLSLPRAPGDLSTLEEGSSEGFVQRPWTEEDKWNLQ